MSAAAGVPSARTVPVHRVAVYAAPGASRTDDPVAAAVLDRAEAWIGRAADGRTVAPREIGGRRRADIDAITVDARRYGFHGTLKAPFRPAPGVDLDDVVRAVAHIADARSAVTIPDLTLARLDGFFALTPAPTADASAVSRLAGDVVRELDHLRAALTPAELERRRPERLTDRQRTLLTHWGYPYVLDEFRFHLTLTDRIPVDDRDEVEHVLRGWFADALGTDLAVDALAVFVEPAPGAPFTLHSVHPLRAADDREARSASSAHPADDAAPDADRAPAPATTTTTTTTDQMGAALR